MNKARENILNRLKKNCISDNGNVPLFIPEYGWTTEKKIEKFTSNIQAVHAEVHRTSMSNWFDTLLKVLEQKQIKSLLVSRETDIGQTIYRQMPEFIQLIQYEQNIESWKKELFSKVSAGLTTTKGGIAETGSLILWPTSHEPRLMSLVPPIHIAILDAGSLYDTFALAVQKQCWTDSMPTNAILVSGPSKTADIEQVLAYGVHGPKELIVLIRE